MPKFQIARDLYEACQDDIRSLIEEFPGFDGLIAQIAEFLECDIYDITFVDTLLGIEDYEGWKLESFGIYDSEIILSELKTLETKSTPDHVGITLGEVRFITLRSGEHLVVCTDGASPWTVYAKYEN